jgi:lauroyl/myristoyl acyltransferase
VPALARRGALVESIRAPFKGAAPSMSYYLMRFIQWLAGHVPRPVRWAIVGFITECAYWAWAAKRHATQRNMAVIFDLPPDHPKVRRAARLSWRHYGRFLADFFDLPNHPSSWYLDRLVDVTRGPTGALDLVEEAKARGHGVIITSAHFGNWDAAGIMVSSRHQIYILAEHLGDARLSEMIQEQRRELGMVVVMLEDSLLPLMRHLRAGGIMATPIDRPLPAGEGVPVRFFGRTTYVPRGLGAMAARTGAAILPGFAWYAKDGTFHGRAFPPVFIAPSGDAEADTIAATQAMFDALEVVVRDDPTQWYMFRQFWPDDEIPGAPSRQAEERQPVQVKGGAAS